MYGHPVGVHYRGNAAYKTALGGILTLATFILICINTADLAIQYFDNSAQKESENTIKEDLLYMEPIHLDENFLQISLVHYGARPPPKIGVWKALKYTFNFAVYEKP